MVGLVNGIVSGLVTITPACGYVDITGAFFIGLIAGNDDSDDDDVDDDINDDHCDDCDDDDDDISLTHF